MASFSHSQGPSPFGHSHNYPTLEEPPRRATPPPIIYEKPAHLLEPVPTEGLKQLSTLSDAHLPDSGTWKLELLSMKWTLKPEDNVFDPEDYVCLWFWSLPVQFPYSWEKSPQKDEWESWKMSYGPFKLADFAPVTVEFPAFRVNAISYDRGCIVRMVAATPEDGRYVDLARASVPFEAKHHPGFSKESDLYFNVPPNENGQELYSGIQVAYRLTLVSIDRRLGPVLDGLIAQTHSLGRCPLILGGDYNAPIWMLSLKRTGTGKYQLWSMDNKYPGDLRSSGNFEFGKVKDAYYHRGAYVGYPPLWVLLRNTGARCMLSLVENRLQVFPNLKLWLAESPSQWRPKEQFWLRTKISLDDEEIFPVYHHERANVLEENIDPKSWQIGEDPTEVKAFFEPILNENTHLWVNVANRMMVVCSDVIRAQQYIEGQQYPKHYRIQGLLIAIPMKEEHVPLFANVPPPFILPFDDEKAF